MKTQQLPKLTKRLAADRGQADHGWLQARFTFSLASYMDPDHMGFKALRVMNNDTIQPGGGFPMHPHEEMEIFTYIINGQLQHRDSMGNGAVIDAGNLQYMSAGAGITHSEFNPSKTDKTHLYQIWLRPNERGGEPRYAEKPVGDLAKPNQLALLFSPDGREGSTAIRQNATISFGRIDQGQSITVPVAEGMPHAWIQVIDGNVTVFDQTLQTGDGLAIEVAPGDFAIDSTAASQFLLFRLN